MLLPPLSQWSLRRVLLAGSPCPMRSAMQAQLCAVGARVSPAPDPPAAEPLCRALHEGRYACIVIPDLAQLCAGGAQARLAALNMLLGEAREAGVPLVMILCAACDKECAPLCSHALGFAHGACGDPVSIQCIRHGGGALQRICRDALALGSRFLAGETGCTGIFTLGDMMEPPP